MRLSITLLALLSALFSAMAQQELPDRNPALPLPGDSVHSFMRPVSPDAIAPSPEPNLEKAEMLSNVKSTLSLPSVFAPAPVRLDSPVVTAPGYAGFHLWKGASAYATGSTTSLPGLMGIESGQVGFTQQIGNLTVSAYASANHYGYFRGMQTYFGFGGSLNYRFSPRLAITVFGSYSTGLTPLTPAMAGYMSAPNFGGYVSYDINEHWGVNVGAQATRSLVTNRWEAQPIVEPYYKINGKAAIGVDVGGILYNVLKSHSEQKNGYRSNPTLGPPVGGPPPVAPRPDK